MRHRQSSLWLCSLSLIFLGPWACTNAPPVAAVDRDTQPGERLWWVSLQAPGLRGEEMDRDVARPLMRALAKQPGAQVVGARSGPGRLVVYLRTPVALSSVRMAERALAQIALPVGSAVPQFGAAGPPGRAPETPNPPEDPQQLFSRGLAAADLLAALSRRPAWLAAPIGRAGPFAAGCCIRLGGRTPAALEARRTARLAGLGSGQKPGLLLRHMPAAEERVRLADGRLARWICVAPGPGGALPAGLGAECRPVQSLSDAERALLRWPTPSAGGTTGLEQRTRWH